MVTMLKDVPSLLRVILARSEGNINSQPPPGALSDGNQ